MVSIRPMFDFRAAGVDSFARAGALIVRSVSTQTLPVENERLAAVDRRLPFTLHTELAQHM